MENQEKLAELRARYEKLRAICGAQVISRQTVERYQKQIARIEAQTPEK